MVGNAHRNSIYLVCHLVEHLPEVLETGNFREHRDDFLGMFGSHIHITEGNYVTQSGIIQFFGNFATAVSDTDKGNIYSVIGTDKGILRHGISFCRNPEGRNH